MFAQVDVGGYHLFFFVAVGRFRIHGRPQFIQQPFLKMFGSVFCRSMCIHFGAVGKRVGCVFVLIDR